MDIEIQSTILNKSNIDKITAIWAFSEAALGGILHLLKIPFTGFFVGSAAVIFISLIAYFSNSRKIIFESVIKVILVKFVVSPYTPLNAYFAVMFQCLLGYILFFNGFNKISPIILGLFALLFSAFQKVFVLTIIFGMTLWESIDVFFKFVINAFGADSLGIEKINVSYVIVGTYTFIHIIGGLAAGIYASKLPKRISLQNADDINLMNLEINDFLNSGISKKEKRTWWKKRFNISIFIFSVMLIVLSYLFKEVDQTITSKVIIMLFRSILIIVVWYYFISPLMLKFLNKYLAKRKKYQAAEIENIISIFPNIKAIIKYSWSESENIKGIKRILIFMDKVLIHYLLFEKY